MARGDLTSAEAGWCQERLERIWRTFDNPRPGLVEDKKDILSFLESARLYFARCEAERLEAERLEAESKGGD